LLARKFDAATNGGTVLTQVKAIDYRETDSVIGQDARTDTLEMIDNYRLPIVA